MVETGRALDKLVLCHIVLQDEYGSLEVCLLGLYLAKFLGSVVCE